MKPKKIKKALDVLTKALEEDGNYEMSWIANIAMCYVDAYNIRLKKLKKKNLNSRERHSVANEAAVNFLDMLKMKSEG